MKTIDEIYEDAMIHWRDNKGVGTALIPHPLNDKCLVLGILQRIHTRSPACNTLIITTNFKERTDLIEFITHQEDEENNEEFKKYISDKNIKIFTADYIDRNGIFFTPFVCILYHCDKVYDKVIYILSQSKFKLVVLNKIIPSSEDMNKIYSVSPLLDDFKQNELDELRVSTPVEDIWTEITIPENSEVDRLLKYYNEYVATSLSIFGSFDIIQQARVGNAQLNISANQICNQIAYENGWNEHLDMSVELNVQLDELYNPGSIRDRASKTYEIIRNRSQVLSDYDDKLDKILKIVEENKDSKILIINKRGEFANKVTAFLNNMSETTICGNYHDKVEPIPATDEHGNPLFYKSGSSKGKRRYLCSQAQKTQNEAAFNNGKLRVLSTNSAPDKQLSIDVDVIIITSPLCEDIKSYIYRLSNVYYPSGKIKLYSLYVKNSLEQTRLQNKPLANIHTIINKCENNVVSENNSDFVIVD